MRHLRRDEIVDFQTYQDTRDAFRKEAMAAKDRRRIHVGDHLMFLFENNLTVRYQVQEMMRTEQLVREADIQHELDTYNELLGGGGELGCTLFIEIIDEKERDEKLRAWLGLIDKLYARVPDGTIVRPSYDPRQVGDDRLSSVQYLKFPSPARPPSPSVSTTLYSPPRPSSPTTSEPPSAKISPKRTNSARATVHRRGRSRP